MQLTLDDTNYRRQKQIDYNTKNNITPTQIKKSLDSILAKSSITSYTYDPLAMVAAEQALSYMSKPEIEKMIRDARKKMEEAAKSLDFINAAKYRDEIERLKLKI